MPMIVVMAIVVMAIVGLPLVVVAAGISWVDGNGNLSLRLCGNAGQKSQDSEEQK
jgi:hypothetical protein